MNLIKLASVLALAAALPACSESTTGPIQQDGEILVSTLSVENYVDTASYALTFFANAQGSGQNLPMIQPNSFLNPDSTVIDSDTQAEIQSHSCSPTGTANLTISTDGEESFEFFNCAYNKDILNGTLKYSGGKYGQKHEMQDFTAFLGIDGSTHSVTSGIIDNNNIRGICNQRRSREVSGYKVTTGDQSFELNDWTTTVKTSTPTMPGCTVDSLEITGQYSVRSASTGDQSLKVRVVSTVTGTSNNPTAGVINISADDGSSIAIDFGTDDSSTSKVTVTNNEGEFITEEPTSTWAATLLPQG